MKTTLLIAFLFLIQTKTKAQEYIFGKVLSENSRELRDVSVINVTTQATTETNEDGNFMIFAKVGDEIRFTKERYNRKSTKINASNILQSFLINLEIIPYNIEEVELKYKLTGDLNKDANHFGKSKKILKFEDDMATYMKAKSSPVLMAPQKGDFVQPVGPGFSIGKVKSQWDDIDLSADLRKNIPEEFFLKQLNLKSAEIPQFIFYVLRNFERTAILGAGYCESSDYARFEMEALQKIAAYKNNIPNESKNKNLKLKTKNLVLKQRSIK